MLPKIGNYPPGPLPILGTRGGRRARRGEGRLREGLERCPLLLAPQQNFILASLPTLHVFEQQKLCDTVKAGRSQDSVWPPERICNTGCV